MEDVLFSLGSIVKVTPNNDEQTEYLIIGKRVVNPNSYRAWDYVSVPTEHGFKWNVDKRNDKIEFAPNFFYFNHFEIEEVVKIADEVE
ncbi:DUF4176 domain-containing protein (plasmid) [Aneurinibacillus sp. Ricciae_BoGa-3]|uniref:DUF4176 domain-containing protein n=1 Tax=Aneurinibacillus sp. Ricciae_BoGa-3 TaxID=3022697 RepID=UPI00233F8DC9|nr:DUF4176 domain-containing protein [Aneurinibacillus sp. Ricciae_BoGa-3]WCK57124.1 DUF4176 domain-containing protein [Aneurinibacillus sp. Ricciae_BoGa-3]